MRSKTTLFAFLSCWTLAAALAAQDKPEEPAPVTKDKGVSEKERDIRKLLEMTGASSDQVMKQMIGNFKRTMPQAPEEFWEEFTKEVRADELVDLVVPIYDKHLTHEDIKGLIDFYSSPLGKKLLAVMPKINEGSIEAGQRWGTELGQRVVERLQKTDKKDGI